MYRYTLYTLLLLVAFKADALADGQQGGAPQVDRQVNTQADGPSSIADHASQNDEKPTSDESEFEALFGQLVAAGATDEEKSVAFAMWLPYDMFSLVMPASTPNALSDRDQILDALRRVTVLAVGQADEGPNETLRWYSPDDLYRGLAVIYTDADGKAHHLTKAARVRPAAKCALGVVQPIFTEGFGGNAKHFFFWYADDVSPRIDPYAQGKLEITFTRRDGNTVTRNIELPVPALVAAKSKEARTDTEGTRNMPAEEQPAATANRGPHAANVVVDHRRAESLAQQGMAAFKQGDAAAAVELLGQAVETYGGNAKADDIAVRTCLAIKAKALLKCGLIEEVEPTLSFLLTSPAGEVSKANAVADQHGWDALVDVYLARKDYAKAQKALRESQRCESLVTGSHPKVKIQHTIAGLQKDAAINIGLGDLNAAEASLTEAVGLYEKEFTAEEAQLAIFDNTFGMIAEKRGDFAKAQKRFEDALQRYTDSYGEGSLMAINALNNVYRTLVAQKMDEKVAEMESRVAKIEIRGDGSVAAGPLSVPAPQMQKEISEAIEKDNNTSDSGVLAILVAITLPLICLLLAAGLTKGVQRVRVDWPRWAAIAVVSAVVLAGLSAALAGLESSFRQEPAARFQQPNPHAMRQAVRSIGTLCGIVFSIGFVVAVVSAFKASALAAPRAWLGPRVLAAATCAGAVSLWLPITTAMGRTIAGPRLSQISSQAFELMFSIIPYTFLLALVWGLCGVIGSLGSRVMAGRRSAHDPRATSSPPPTPPSGS